MPYRPPHRTPRPVVHGSQTAVVVGPAGEEIYVDKYARVKVHFHWDRRGKKDEKSSCWVRVATPWGGKGYGNVTVPRIGNEVVVIFLEGDPDRPLALHGDVPRGVPLNASQVSEGGFVLLVLLDGLVPVAAPVGGYAHVVENRSLAVDRHEGVPAVVLVVGVNGTGKTTTVGKLARVLVAEDHDVVLGAADTFRAAAADQLGYAQPSISEQIRPMHLAFSGNYDLKIHWNDGHQTGLYTWDHLERLSHDPIATRHVAAVRWEVMNFLASFGWTWTLTTAALLLGAVLAPTDPVLAAGIVAVSGEPRVRYLYVEDGARDDVIAAWFERCLDLHGGVARQVEAAA